MGSFVLSAYGLTVESSFALPGAEATSARDQPAVELRLGDPAEIEREWSGSTAAPAWQAVFPNGRPVRCERGWARDHRLSYGSKAGFHLSADGNTLICAPADADDLEWKKFLLETVLHCASLARGFEALHASAVSTPRGIVAVVATSGTGKSSLAAELVRRGNALVCDDVLALSRVNGQIFGHPGPPVMSLSPAGPPSPPEVGEALGDLPDTRESWIHVRHSAGEPGPIAAVYLLDRRDGLRPGVLGLGPSTRALLPHSLCIDANAERATGRFALLSRLTALAPVYRLQGNLDCEPARLADLLEESLRGNAEPLASEVA